MMVYPGHRVELTRRFFADIQVHMDYHWFPYDKQVWEIQFQSLTNDATKLKLVPNGADKDADFDHPLWDVTQVKMDTADLKLFTGKTHSRATVRIHAERFMSFYMVDLVIPLNVIVLFAWASFWINPDKVPARMTLCITTVLTVLFLNYKVSQGLPKISYVTWMDAYMLFTFLMTSSALFMFVRELTRRERNFVSLSDLDKSVDNKNDSVGRWVFFALIVVWNVAMFSSAIYHLKTYDNPISSSTTDFF
jgi:Neurotransmitter-gated ion-channel transmembrane region